MFTGIITDIGRIEAVEPRGDLRVRIACGYDMGEVDLGASIACSGVCDCRDKAGHGSRSTSGERERTAPHMWAQARSSTSSARQVGDELGGHIVTGMHRDRRSRRRRRMESCGSGRAGAELAP